MARQCEVSVNILLVGVKAAGAKLCRWDARAGPRATAGILTPWPAALVGSVAAEAQQRLHDDGFVPAGGSS